MLNKNKESCEMLSPETTIITTLPETNIITITPETTVITTLTKSTIITTLLETTIITTLPETTIITTLPETTIITTFPNIEATIPETSATKIILKNIYVMIIKSIMKVNAFVIKTMDMFQLIMVLSTMNVIKLKFYYKMFILIILLNHMNFAIKHVEHALKVGIFLKIIVKLAL